MSDHIQLVKFTCGLFQATPLVQPDQFRLWSLMELRSVIEFDQALWMVYPNGSESASIRVRLNVPDAFIDSLERGRHSMFKALRDSPGRAQTFSQSPTGPNDGRTDSERGSNLLETFSMTHVFGLCLWSECDRLLNLLILARSNDQQFAINDAEFSSAAARALVLSADFCSACQLETAASRELGAAAICNGEGIIHQTQPSFIALLKEKYPAWQEPSLPFTLPTRHPSRAPRENGLFISTRALGELILIQIRQINPRDRLTPRELDIVDAICGGQTFKEAARAMDIAPSTVANGFYRILRKLKVTNRSQLRSLIANDLANTASTNPTTPQ